MAINNIHGFDAKHVRELKPKKFTAVSYLKNQLIFLKRLNNDLDPDTKTGMLVGAQIPNLEMALEELDV
ncbi:hypothetical protein LNP18_07165 [Leuconostoc citreum]|uniref:hypothetical protein n=1 Tax=Leuconostoc citreum TaxID=33964 RepID=UPI00200AB8FA|nr:hypothetical protein [Leuconostoc citreum]MCK8605884.1 hypothetical protein [Leuconostoc citreum]